MSHNQASGGIKIYGGSARKEMFELHKTVSDKPRQLDRSLLVMLCTHAETANAIADRLEELERENTALRADKERLDAIIEECKERLVTGWWHDTMYAIYRKPHQDGRNLIDAAKNKS